MNIILKIKYDVVESIEPQKHNSQIYLMVIHLAQSITNGTLMG